MPAIEAMPITDLLDGSPAVNREAVEEAQSPPLAFFRLDGHPFADNVNPQFFYRTDAHEQAFVAMRRCIEENVSLGLTTAASGTGKTLLTQVLLQELPRDRYRPAIVLIYPSMSRSALLREICAELGIEAAPRATTHALVNGIQQRIMELHVRGVKLVLIIDEVHFLTADNLQVLRTLSNIEIPEKKLVTVLLFGEDSFHAKLQHPTFRSILSRMYVRVHLRALSREEVEQYVKFRLLLVNGRGGLFEPACFDWLYETTGGVPRDINRICHNALHRAAQAGRRTISPDLLAS